MSDYPREITLKDNTKVTVFQTHTVMIEQAGDSVLISAEELMQILIAMRDTSTPEPPPITL